VSIPLVNRLSDIYFLRVFHAASVQSTLTGTLGLRLRAARGRAGLTQPQLAAETGVLQSRISELENDKRVKIDVWSVHAICKRLGITVEYLLDGGSQAGDEEAEAVALLRHAEPQLRDAAMNALRGMLSGKPRAVAARH